MRSQIFCFVLAVLSFCFISKTYSSHIVGGVLNYKYIGNNTYEIRLTVYRDCFGNPGATFDNPAHIGIFDSNNNLTDSIQLNLPPIDTLDPNPSNPCPHSPIVCYERAQYFGVKYLLPNPGGYQLAYQRCCRSANLLNFTLPGTVGATYYASIPDISVAVNNSNPVFNNQPDVNLCVNYPYTFDHSATDYEGDSLVYSLYTPLDGASAAVPIPIPTNSPTYVPLTYNAPYSQSNFLGGIPLSINPQTGWLTATPNTLGQFAVGVQVEEYRNGVYLGATKRDVHLYVILGNLGALKMAAKKEDEIGLSPNPVKDFVTISFNLNESSWVSLSIVNELGQIVSQRESIINSGKQDIEVSTKTFTKGIYSLVYTNNSNYSITSKKFIKSE